MTGQRSQVPQVNLSYQIWVVYSDRNTCLHLQFGEEPVVGMNTGTEPAQPFACQVMLKPRGAICNLDCSYCYYLSKEKLYPGRSFRMSDELLEEFIRQYIESQNVPEIVFAWQGGEPLLMGLDFYRKAVEYQHRYAPQGVRIVNAFQTNGLLLDEEWCSFLHDHGFLIGLSLDGPEEMHDAFRVDRGGGPTWARVMKGLEYLQGHEVEFNILTCVHAANMHHPVEVYRFLRDEVEAWFIQFIPIVERDNETGLQEGERITDRSVTGQAYGSFLIDVFDEWVRSDVGSMFVQIFDVALAAWHGMRPSLCIFEETCGTALVMEHNGDLYCCDHFVEPRHLLGNIRGESMMDLVRSDQQKEFGLAKRDTLPRFCRDCDVRFVCNGGCPKNRVLRTSDDEPGLNWLCEGYRAFFGHIDPAMRFMAGELRAGRAPANVMNQLPGSGF